MRSEKLNRTIDMTVAEKDAIVNSLVSAGVDRKTIDAVFTPLDGNCPSLHISCPSFAPNSEALNKLQAEIKSKGIDIQKINPAIKKLMQ